MSQTHIPEQMSAAFLHSYTGVMALRVEQCPVPQPGPNEVLIKVAACYLKCMQMYALIHPQRFNLSALRWSFRSPLITCCWVQLSLQLESCP
jgi:hypothetical protein